VRDEHPDEHQGADVLVVDVDPIEHGDALADLERLGRVIIASPDAGPVPLVLDVDRALVAEVRAALS
jgi:hypothetical protein